MTSSDGHGKAVLITGGNSGVGYGCARHLAKAGQRVILGCRDEGRASQAVRALIGETGNAAIETLSLDLASSRSVRNFAARLKERGIALNALICNAGIQIVRGIAFTEDGTEMTFGVNHLGHFLLVHLLLDTLVANAPARIVVVSSGVHDPTRRTGMPKPAYTDFASLARGAGSNAPYNGRLAYVNSKLCNMLFAYELKRRIEAAGLSTPQRPVTVNAFEPGLVPGSGLARDYHRAAQFAWNRILPVLSRFLTTVNTADAAGRALARLVLDPALEGVSGKYFASHTSFRATPSSAESYDAQKARQLWETSAALCRLAPTETPLPGGAARAS